MYVILYLFCIIILIYALFIGYNLQLFKNQNVATTELYEFNVDVEFKQQTSVDIENNYDCNAKSLHTCDINDASTLFGCRELTVRCQHFDKDTEFKENGKIFIIPKNTTKTEGYALAITNVAESCNPYHGDLVLVTLNSNSNDYMLICSCKNPGYIGNVSLLGSCENVFICDGKIDNINKPLDKINCQCDKHEHSLRYNDGLPTCKPLLVKEANELYDDWSNYVDWISDRKININIFNKTIQQNLKTSVLLNPCASSVHDLSEKIPNGRYSSVTKTCVFENYGYPVRNGLLNDSKTKFSPVDGGLNTGEYDSIRVSGNVAGVKQFGAIKATMNFYDGKMADMIVPNDITVGQNTQLDIKIINNNVWGPSCEVRSAFAFRWNCWLRNQPRYYDKNIPRFGFSPLPDLWSQRELWNATETAFNDSFYIDTLTGVHVNQRRLNDSEHIGYSTLGYGLKLSKRGNGGLISLSNEDDWKLHYNTIT